MSKQVLTISIAAYNVENYIERAILLYGVSIPNNTIVAAGSVVTKSISPYEERKIIGGIVLAGNIKQY